MQDYFIKAAITGDLETVKENIDNRKSNNAYNGWVLTWAALCGQHEVVKFLKKAISAA